MSPELLVLLCLGLLVTVFVVAAALAERRRERQRLAAARLGLRISANYDDVGSEAAWSVHYLKRYGENDPPSPRPCQLRWKPRLMVRPVEARSPGGWPVFSFGFRVGIWPCLRAPFLQLSLGLWHVDAWIGYPSLKQVEGGDR
jgi:hypothetical protein